MFAVGHVSLRTSSFLQQFLNKMNPHVYRDKVAVKPPASPGFLSYTHCNVVHVQPPGLRSSQPGPRHPFIVDSVLMRLPSQSWNIF